jgi:hypothetical protein
MKKIVLNIKDENMDTILNILENLKDGLIDSMEYDCKKAKVRYQPKTTTIVRENQKPEGKYLSSREYRKTVK